MSDVDVVVIGAGQAGLAGAYHLRRSGIGFVVLDDADGPGGAWRQRWPTLRLDTVHRIHDLPGLGLGPQPPDAPAAEVMTRYFPAYERRFDLQVRRPG